MLNNISRINTLYAFALIAFGLLGTAWQYMSHGDIDGIRTLIPAIFGLIFYPLSDQMKDGAKFLRHMTIGLTALIAAAMLMLYLRIDAADAMASQKRITYGSVMILSFIVLGLYGRILLQNKD